MQALRCRDQGRGGGTVNLDAFLAAVVFEQREYFQFVDQIGGGMAAPDFQTRMAAPSAVPDLRV
jgi:hypothetical protein